MTREPRIVHDGRQGAARVAAFLHHVGPWLTGHFTILALTVLGLSVAARFVRVPGRLRALRRTAKARNLTAKLRAPLGWRDGADKFVKWPARPDRPGATVAIRYPKTFIPTAAKIAFIPELVHQLAGGQWAPDHDHAHNRLRWRRLPPDPVLPAQLAYTDIAAPPDQIPLGVRATGQPLTWEWAVPSYPHVLLGGTTGSGKSNATRLLITGVVRNGGLVDILDAKGGEDFEAFHGNPSIRLHTDPAGMLAAVRRFKAEYEARKPTRGAERDRLPRHVLLIDEAAEIPTVLAAELGKSAADEYVSLLLSCAALVRASRMHLIVATQKPTATALTGNATTGARLRDLLGHVIGLGRLSASSATMLFGEPSPPVDERTTGRGVVHENGEFVAVQLARLDLADAARLAAGPSRFPAGEPVAVDVGADVGDVGAPHAPAHVAHVNANANIPDRRVTFPCPKCAGTVRTGMRPGAVGARHSPCGWKGRVPVAARMGG